MAASDHRIRSFKLTKDLLKDFVLLLYLMTIKYLDDNDDVLIISSTAIKTEIPVSTS